MSTLYLVATPIGNVEDISLRAIKILYTVPVIVAEDTRHTGNLFTLLDKRTTLLDAIFTDSPRRTGRPTFIALYDEVEAARIPSIIAKLQSGQDVALVSDAGTPLIADPGFKLVRHALAQKINVVPIPGPTAAITALVGSGQIVNNFLFVGYLPTKQRARAKYLQELQKLTQLPKTPSVICYEAPHRLVSTIMDIQETFPNTKLTVAQELTKIHESILTMSPTDHLAHWDKHKPKGEYTIIFVPEK